MLEKVCFAADRSSHARNAALFACALLSACSHDPDQDDATLAACLHFAGCVAVPNSNPGPFNSQGTQFGALTSCGELAGFGELPIGDDRATFGETVSDGDRACIVAAGTDCAKVYACLARAPAKVPCATQGGVSCHGDVLVFCTDLGGGLQEQPVDCRGGGVCRLDNRGNPFCANGSCQRVGPDPMSSELLCAGGDVDYCVVSSDGSAYLMLDYNCAIEGGACFLPTQPQAQPTCGGTGDACDVSVVSSVPSCDGATNVYCLGGRVARLDCSLHGQRCVSDVPNMPAHCGPTGFDCELVHGPPTCDGTRLTFCDNGEPRTIDCAQLGYRGCDSSAGGRCTL